MDPKIVKIINNDSILQDYFEGDNYNHRCPINNKEPRPNCFKDFEASFDNFDDRISMINLPSAIARLRFVPSIDKNLPKKFTLIGGGSTIDQIDWKINWVLYLIDQQRKEDNLFSIEMRNNIFENSVFDRLVAEKISNYKSLNYLSYKNYCRRIIKYSVGKIFNSFLVEKIYDYFQLEIPIYFSSSSNLISPGAGENATGERYDFCFHALSLEISGGQGKILCDQHYYDHKCQCDILKIAKMINGNIR